MRGTYEKDGRRHAMGKAAKYVGYKILQEERNLAVKGILSGRDVFLQALHARVNDRRACDDWARDKVRDFLEYFKFHENSEC